MRFTRHRAAVLGFAAAVIWAQDRTVSIGHLETQDLDVLGDAIRDKTDFTKVLQAVPKVAPFAVGCTVAGTNVQVKCLPLRTLARNPKFMELWPFQTQRSITKAAETPGDDPTSYLPPFVSWLSRPSAPDKTGLSWVRSDQIVNSTAAVQRARTLAKTGQLLDCDQHRCKIVVPSFSADSESQFLSLCDVLVSPRVVSVPYSCEPVMVTSPNGTVYLKGIADNFTGRREEDWGRPLDLIFQGKNLEEGPVRRAMAAALAEPPLSFEVSTSALPPILIVGFSGMRKSQAVEGKREWLAIRAAVREVPTRDYILISLYIVGRVAPGADPAEWRRASKEEGDAIGKLIRGRLLSAFESACHGHVTWDDSRIVTCAVGQ
jgi:hypothetical protein